MPYWRRPEALARNLKRLRDLYHDIEIVVVDDGSPEPATGPARIIRLPDKDHALNPCVPINRGVEAARGEYIVLTNPEIVHRSSILDGLLAECERLGPKAYVAAACWGGEWWYCHSTNMPPAERVGRAPYPKGAGLHFCAMLRRDFFEAIGGFDEEYRDGQGYDDNDFLWRLHAAGAVFSIRDDLVTDHVQGDRCKWPAGGAARNRQIFERKWQAIYNVSRN